MGRAASRAHAQMVDRIFNDLRLGDEPRLTGPGSPGW